jgi:hypothetical protein
MDYDPLEGDIRYSLETLFALTPFLLRPLSFGEVGNKGLVELKVTISVEGWMDEQFHRDSGAVLPYVLLFVFLRLSGASNFL